MLSAMAGKRDRAMSWAMRLYNTTDKPELIARVVVDDEVPVYLRAYDVNAHDGRGSVAMTRDIAEAGHGARSTK